MSDIAFILGPVVFQDFEVFAGIGFGGEQRLAVHKLPGGVRVIDALGRDDAEITVQGIFSGEDATLRARLLDELRASGAALPLTWDVFFYSVIIRDFQADYQNGYWIPYRLACTVLRDEASALVETAISLAGSVLSDIGSAVMSGFDLGGVDLGGAQSALSAPGAMTRGTGAYGLASSSLAAAQSAIGGGIAGAGGSLGAASSTLSATTDPLAGAGALAGATSAAGQLGALSTARGYIGRAAVNLANAGT
jgi:hypothetical protein